MVNKCIVCGRKFESERKMKICSDQCRKKRRALTQYKKVINQGKIILYKKTCIICGKAFETYKTNKICCSQECSIKLNQLNVKNYNTNNRETLNLKRRKCCKKSEINNVKICVVCGNEFIPNHARALTCSQECSIKSKKENVKKYRETNREILNLKRRKYYINPKICVICNKEFRPIYGQSLTCSKECAKKYKNMKNREWVRKHKEELNNK